MFKEEVMNKKRTGIGIFSRTGTRGYVGKMRTPFDLMSKKEKAKIKRSKVLKYNMYTILPLVEFQKLPNATQKEALVRWRTELSSTAIQKAWSMGTTQFYKIVRELGIEPDRKANFKGKPQNVEAQNATKSMIEKEQQKREKRGPYSKKEKGEVSVMQPAQTKLQTTTSNFRELPVYAAPPEGIMLNLEGSYTSVEIYNKLTKVVALLEGETNKFKISINIQEIMNSVPEVANE